MQNQRKKCNRTPWPEAHDPSDIPRDPTPDQLLLTPVIYHEMNTHGRGNVVALGATSGRAAAWTSSSASTALCSPSGARAPRVGPEAGRSGQWVEPRGLKSGERQILPPCNFAIPANRGGGRTLAPHPSQKKGESDPFPC